MIPNRLKVLCFPEDDRLRSRITMLLEGANGTYPPADLAAWVEGQLRSRYPDVVVRKQHPLASFPGEVTWYVYRDGRPCAEVAPSPQVALPAAHE